jgi:TonB-dependent SusC/RagA subfamily outer membrane receptor
MKEPLIILLLRNFKRPKILRLFFRLFLLIIAVEINGLNASIYAQAAQRITITGTVTDGSTGEALPAVNIVVQGTTTGTATDISGKYLITVPNEQSVLVFTFIGYNPQNITVGKQRQISVALIPNLKALSEVIVVGYGVQKKESVVGAISQASGEVVKRSVQGSDLGNALTGALPGLVTISTNGLPGGSGEDDDYTLMLIRGQKTWNNAQPLVLVDGVERPLQNINPYEIEKISLLKDASATAVFGVKGANGVILITTNRGKE